MRSKARRSIAAKVIADTSKLTGVSKDELLRESEQYDPDSYDPLADIDSKELLIPSGQSDRIVTIRLTKEEDELIRGIAKRNGISKSALVRMAVRRGLKGL